MSQRQEAESLGPTEKEQAREGVRINFANPEVLRAHILSPETFRRTSTFAEKMSGIREVPLGEFLLDGKLFHSTRFTLIVEPYRDRMGKKPTVIIRADIQLGGTDSKFRRVQQERLSQGGIMKFLYGGDVELTQNEKAVEIITLKKEGIYIQPWSRNTSKIHRNGWLEEGNLEEEPVVVLQTWDKDMGIGFLSISLVSDKRYYGEWQEREAELRERVVEREGWEVDGNYEVDSWKFKGPVGVDVYDATRFSRDIRFYEEAFFQALNLLYQLEGAEAPTLLCEIEAPMVFGEHKETTFSEIGGQNDAINRLRSQVSLIKSGARHVGNKSPFLLYGPPGNGKTSLAQAAANELQAPLLIKTTKDLPPTAQGSDFLNLLEAGYLEAKAAAKVGGGRSVYCIEGVEALIGEEVRLQDRFLNLMDEWTEDSESNVLIIATSNFPQNLHPGVISRFNDIPILQPNAVGRKEILEIHAKKINRVLGQDIFANVDMDRVAERLDGFSGRDIERFLGTVYSLGRLESQEKGKKIEIDTEFVLKLVPDRRLGFKTS